MNSIKTEKIAIITWAVLLIMTVGASLMGWILPARIFSITSWLALVVVIYFQSFKRKKS